MRLTRLAVPFVAAALLATSLAGTAGAAGGGPHRLQVESGTRAAADTPYDVVLRSENCYIDGGTATVVGDVYNLTDLPVRSIQINATVKDVAGRVRGSRTGSPWFEFLDPGEGATFQIEITNANGAATCDASVADWQFTDIPANHYFTTSNVTDTEGAASTTRLSGTLTNNNVVAATGIILVATLYDAQGDVIGTNTVSSSGSMRAGGSTTFSVDVDHAGDAVPDTYLIQTEATSDPQTATTMFADPTEFTYGGSTDVTGKGVPGNLVRVQRYDQATVNWVDIPGDDIKADDTGAYSLTLTPGRATCFRVISGSVASVPIVLFVDAKVTLKASTKKTTVGKKVVLSGVAQPLDPGQKVSIQRKVGSSWKTVATVPVSGSGAFSYAWKPTAKGTYVLRAWADSNSLVFEGNSSSVTIAVK